MNIDILWTVTIALTIFTVFLVVVYWQQYGPQNFLWLSDIGLFLTVLALWLHSSLLISIAVIAILPLELIWLVDYLYRALTGKDLLNIVDYMFDRQLPKWLRALSLFHIVTPLIWIGCLLAWGYNPNALLYAVVMVWLAFIASYFLTDPALSINWVYVPRVRQWRKVPTFLWLIILVVGYPLVVILPMHFLVEYLTT